MMVALSSWEQLRGNPEHEMIQHFFNEILVDCPSPCAYAGTCSTRILEQWQTWSDSQRYQAS